MLPLRSSSVTGPIKRSSVIGISAGPRRAFISVRCSRVKICPPLMQTISPLRIGAMANKPWPWIGLGLTAVLFDRYESGIDAAVMKLQSHALLNYSILAEPHSILQPLLSLQPPI